MRTCGFENQIHPYLDGELTAEALRSFEAHLEDCPECREEVEQLRGLLDGLRGLGERETPPMLRERLHAALANELAKGDGRMKRKLNPWALPAVAAAVVLVAGGLALFSSRGGFLSNMNYNATALHRSMSGSLAAMPAATAAPAAAPQADGGPAYDAEAPVPAPTAAAMYDNFTDKASASGVQGFTADKPGASEAPAKASSDNPPQQAESSPQQTPESRKIIYTANIVIQTRDYNARLTAVEGLTGKYGGYTASSQENGKPGATDQNDARSSVFSLRIPIDKFDAAMADFKAMGDDIASSQKQTDDVSRDYVDTEARNKSLMEERDKLEELMAKATNVDDTIALENQITDLTTQIEQATAQLNFWNDQVAYTTINVEIHEIVEAQSVKPVDRDMGSRVNGAFYGTLNAMKKGWEDFEVGFVGFVPWLVIIAVLAGVAAAIAVPTARRARRAAQRKAAEDKKEEKP